MRSSLRLALAAGALLLALQTANAACDVGSPASGATAFVKGTGHPVRQAPQKNAPRLLNEKATAVLGQKHYHQIDSSVQVRALCQHQGWTKIQIVEPSWLTHVVGWVESKSLDVPTSGPRTISAEDIYWDKGTAKHKVMIVSALNRIHREDPRCKQIDPGSVSRSQKSTPAKPLFFVTCGSGIDVVNVFFSEDDVRSEKQFAAPKHIERSTAISLCEDYAKRAATHPSTVSFSRFMDLAVTDHPNGRTTVNSSFTAKNAFNLKLKHNIRCLLNSSGLMEANISEAR